MPKKDEVIAKLVALLNEKTKGQKPCSVCGVSQWRLQERFVSQPVSNNPNEIRLGGESMPLWPIVCGNCGNTVYLNLLVLGVKDLADVRIDPDEPAKS